MKPILTDDRVNEIARWLLVADRDIKMAEDNQLGFPENAAYMYQQSAEKHLKAFLVLHDTPVKRTHDLSALLLKCSAIDRDFLEIAIHADSETATRMATYYRYPNDNEDDFINDEELRSVASLARLTHAITLQKMPTEVIEQLNRKINRLDEGSSAAKPSDDR